MTANKRIILNIVATYGRSLYSLVLGLFSGRWALHALGQSDYGLYGVVGGLTVFIAFFNNVMAYSIGRFYALSVGKASNNADGLEDCRKWFSIAVVVHTVMPIVLLTIGYPMGIWAVKSYLVIPPDRIESCVWVFRFVCISCFLAMISVPVNAMYTAKQYIAELTVYAFAATTCNFMFLFYMVNHPGFWLVKYAFWGCALALLPQSIIAVRGLYLFPECRLRVKYICSWRNYLPLFKYTGWQMFGTLGALCRAQGVGILVNKSFGPSVNASMSIANTINGQASSLSGAMQSAFMPAITAAYGSGDLELSRRMAIRACKFGVLLSFLFVIPLLLELPAVLKIWLVTPPKYVTGFCFGLMISLVVDKMTIGHMVLVHATGRIASYQVLLGGALIATLPAAWVMILLGLGAYSVPIAFVIMAAVCSFGRLYFAHAYVSLSVKHWMKEVLIPIVIVAGCSLCAGMISKVCLSSGFIRVIVTTICVEFVMLPISWFLILSVSEREYLMSKIHFRRRA